MNSLKYFKEKANEYHVIAAGSLLGTLLAKPKSYPVGMVNLLDLYPLTFDEFLEATDEALYAYYESIHKDQQIEEIFHNRLLEAYNNYLIIGGMPECVASWVKEKDPAKISQIQRELIEIYENDFSKHNGKVNSGRILMVFRSIVSQLAKSNEKFIYGAVRQGGRARDFEEAIEWLVSAGMLNRIYNVSKMEHPLSAFDKLDQFKLFLFDTGLLKHMAGIDNSAILLKADYQFKGPLTENYVLQQLRGQFAVEPRYYYRQIRAISDRLCREHGLSVVVRGESSKAASYVEWLRQSRGQATFRSMLEADLREAIQDANDLGHFFLLMEHKGYEIKHGARLGFRLRGQDRFMVPGRKNPLFTEDGIRTAIQGNLSAIEAGQQPAVLPRTAYRPYTPHPKYKGFLALYVHYLYLLGKIGQRQYPPHMTARLRQEVMKAERYREQFVFLRENNITGPDDMTAFLARTEETLASLTKQRTILNVRKKRRQRLYTALADAEALAPARELYEDGLSGMEAEFTQYLEAVSTLEQCGIPREQLISEKAQVYQQLAELNRQIRQERKKQALCREILERIPQIETELQKTEAREKEVRSDEHRRR